MTKSISAQLLSDIQKGVTTLSVCVEIIRKDGKIFRITNHDADVSFEGQNYDHTIPFQISAIDSGSSLAIDNTNLVLFADGVHFINEHFRDGLFDYAECSIFFVDYENPTHGRLTLRRGWFGPIERNTRNYIEITVTGLLKVLDFEVGRIYQPTCDADLGDKRCKVAINQNQVRSHRNRFRAGDWSYCFDETLMTALTVVNPSFESDGSRSEAQAITGWSKAAGTTVFVATTPNSPTIGVISLTPTPVDGSYCVYAGDDATDNDSGFENTLWQDIDLLGASISAADIDDGKIAILYTAAMASNVYNLDPMKIRVELLDADLGIVSSFDGGWEFLDTPAAWRDRSLCCPIYPTTRFLRIYIMMRKEDGAVANCCFDDIRLWYWDHTLGTPYDDVIHKLTRLAGFGEDIVATPKNPSFEVNSFVANALSPVVADWITTGSWWAVDNDVGALSPSHGSLFLRGGNDGGIVQQTYTATQNLTLTALAYGKIDPSRLLLGKIVGRCSILGYYGDAGLTNSTISVAFYDLANTLLDTVYLANNSSPGSIGISDMSANFALPPTTRSVTITLQVHTPVGSGNGSLVAYDNVRFYFYDAERPAITDPVIASGVEATVFDTTADNYSFDGNLIWRAVTQFIGYDEVTTVTSRKEFEATVMAGSAGTYETGVIWWISGPNAGLKNIIRTWNPDNSSVKLYFREAFDISVGDRFIYIRSCQRRFEEDCIGVFTNGINFRGFPHLPGKLTGEEEAEETA